MRVLTKTLAVAAVLLAAAIPTFAQAADGSITVKDPYARATPSGAMTGAVYMTIDNKANAEDRLIAGASDVAAKIQIHEMSVVNGVMQMREVPGGLAVPADGSVTLKPGGYHVMLIGLKKPLTAGETFPLTLTFAKAGNIPVTVKVQAMGAAPSNGGGMGDMHGGAAKPMGSMEMK